MSSSKKKQLRKEQNMTERQASAAKEAKKLKIYTLSFWVVIVLVLCIFVGTISSNTVNKIICKRGTAVTVSGYGDYSVSPVMLNYFYMEAVQTLYSGYYFTFLGCDSDTPLDQQPFSDDESYTWADYVLDYAISSINSTYAIYDLAMKAGYELSDSEKTSIENQIYTQWFYAVYYYGYSSLDSYLSAIYGTYANEDSYREYLTVKAVADSYYDYYSASLEFSDEEIAAYLKENPLNFNSYTYQTYYIPVSDFIAEGDDAEDEAVYNAAIAAALLAANNLADGEYETVEDFLAAVRELDAQLNPADEEEAEETEDEDEDEEEEEEEEKDPSNYNSYDHFYTSVNSRFTAFLEDTSNVGKLTVITYATTTDDVETTKGYYVVRYEEFDDNTFALANVRHILIQPENGTYNSSTGYYDYDDEDWEDAREEAKLLLNSWLNGEATGETFGALADEESADSPEGGLYENVYPGQMVTNFNDWCFDESRQAGDYAIIETEYGVHIMYFEGHSETSYLDYLITEQLRSDATDEWDEAACDAIVTTLKKSKYVNTGLVLSDYYSS